MEEGFQLATISAQLTHHAMIVTHLELLNGPVSTLVDILLGAGEVNGLDTADLLSGSGR